MMSKFDREKIRVAATEKDFNPGYVLSQFMELLSSLNETTDLIYNSNGIRMSKERYQNSKDYLKAYEKTMLAFRDTEAIGRLTTDQQREILVMVNEVLEGKREAVQFQLNRGCNGIKEVFSSKVFNFKQQQDK